MIVYSGKRTVKNRTYVALMEKLIYFEIEIFRGLAIIAAIANLLIFIFFAYTSKSIVVAVAFQNGGMSSIISNDVIVAARWYIATFPPRQHGRGLLPILFRTISVPVIVRKRTI